MGANLSMRNFYQYRGILINDNNLIVNIDFDFRTDTEISIRFFGLQQDVSFDVLKQEIDYEYEIDGMVNVIDFEFIESVELFELFDKLFMDYI
jgi:hypothetical protein